ncbi:Thermonuclease precursor [Mesomycoplasma conjunctivae]|uniref:PUTATIVE NUCLEASE, LIPOPROTEIN n=1 Tax=Mesomycoplasma conjunctivae (strain ATCC 25834 / NCTC 10147 / HRC/581) TaxID=572263 RepID=C5J707_MESCH|nr:thermonuclease family protein [Mesomycoplasma conjunctivae]CAT05270.1 PUTATIVE NUCLEASE, LIPOPROTEIN [Mesomycoplasma conjunctivae]VEU66500.1 Thermonuclease precursor [Mesomycoplasma conjunctivae]
MKKLLAPLMFLFSLSLASCSPLNSVNQQKVCKNEEKVDFINNQNLPFVYKATRIQVGNKYLTKVKSVYDGDTFTDYVGNKIRLFGIDTPEIKNTKKSRKLDPKLARLYAEKAKKILRDYIENSTVEIEVVAKDDYGRNVAIIRKNDQIINLILLARGLAIMRYFDIDNKKSKYYQPNYKKLYNTFKSAEENAKKQKLNVWSQDDINKIYVLKKNS